MWRKDDYEEFSRPLPQKRLEYVQRPDGRWNVWKFGYLFRRDNIRRWILIGVIRDPAVRRKPFGSPRQQQQFRRAA